MKKALLLTSALTLAAPCLAKEKLVSGKINGGLFAGFFAVLNQLRWCEKNDTTPVVYWGPESHYYEPEGYQGATKNVWEYYFEPVSSARYKKGDDIRRDYQAPDGKEIPGPMAEKYLRNLTKSLRVKINDLINRYIKIKPHITQKVEDFYEAHMKDIPTIGIHIRGTDKFMEAKVITVEQICERANKVAQKYPSYQFLIATDEQSILEKAKKLLSGPVIHYEAYRSLDGRPIHNGTSFKNGKGIKKGRMNKPDHTYNKAKMGEEVIIEVLLLSKCQEFVHMRSNVSTAVLFFNPEVITQDFETW